MANAGEFTKRERALLRELASAVYEAEAHGYLEQLEAEFSRWRKNEIDSSELLQTIHEFHQQRSRELWSRYQSLKEPEIVARGLALGFLSAERVPQSIRETLEPLVEIFAKHRRY